MTEHDDHAPTRCPVCDSDEWIMDVPNDPTGDVWCANPVHHGGDVPTWTPDPLT